jgi:hypothetical protein
MASPEGLTPESGEKMELKSLALSMKGNENEQVYAREFSASAEKV